MTASTTAGREPERPRPGRDQRGRGQPGQRVSGTRVPGTRWVIPQNLFRWLKPIMLAVVTVAVIGLLAAYVFPTRTWIDQRQALAEVGATLDELDAEKEALAARIELLDTDEEVEAIARSQFGLVLPGEEAYSVMPAPEQAILLPEIWPYGPIQAPESVAKATPVNPAG